MESWRAIERRRARVRTVVLIGIGIGIVVFQYRYRKQGRAIAVPHARSPARIDQKGGADYIHADIGNASP